jgi:hypothetical protein
VSDQLMDLAIMLKAGPDSKERELVARLAGRLGYTAVHLPIERGATLPEGEFERLTRAADPALVILDDGTDAEGIVRRNDPALVRQVRARLDEMNNSRPLIVAIPISIGRTFNEAMARAERDERFTGDAHPRESGIYGTFEQAQNQVLELARAGADVLLVTVPHELDVADVLAQIKALVVGATPALFQR